MGNFWSGIMQNDFVRDLSNIPHIFTILNITAKYYVLKKRIHPVNCICKKNYRADDYFTGNNS